MMAESQPTPVALDCAAFSTCVGGRFHISVLPQWAEGHAPPAGPVELVLAEAKDLPTRSDGPRKAPFSLVFRGGHDVFLPQGTYPLEHPSFGAIEVFLVPIGPDGEGHQYQAIFN